MFDFIYSGLNLAQFWCYSHYFQLFLPTITAPGDTYTLFIVLMLHFPLFYRKYYSNLINFLDPIERRRCSATLTNIEQVIKYE